LILKVLQARPDEQPSDSHYWKREAEVYRSGWLPQLSGGLVAPRCRENALGDPRLPGEKVIPGQAAPQSGQNEPI